mgnify:CR=1 FL=1
MERVYNRRVLHTTPQASKPFMKIWIGDRLLSYTMDNDRKVHTPNIYQNLTLTRLEDAGSRLGLSLYDREWETIESDLSKNYNNTRVQYGFVDGAVSPIYKMIMLNYNIDYRMSGIILTTNGMSTGAVDNLEDIDIDTGGTLNPTEAVKSICKSMGWKVVDSNFDSSSDAVLTTTDSFDTIQENPIKYIKEYIIPNIPGDDNYYFYLDDSTDPPTAYFKKYTYNNTEATKTYVYMRGYDTPVLSLSMDVNGLLGGMELTPVTNMISGVIDPYTKEQSTVTQDIDAVRTTVTGTYSHTPKYVADAKYNSVGYNKAQTNTILKYSMKRTSDRIYTGNMTIVGDPTMKMLDTIRIIVITDKGNLHHTSGLYIVTGITDNVSSTFTTTLKFIRNGDIETGIELVNYRNLVR